MGGKGAERFVEFPAQILATSDSECNSVPVFISGKEAIRWLSPARASTTWVIRAPLVFWWFGAQAQATRPVIVLGFDGVDANTPARIDEGSDESGAIRKKGRSARFAALPRRAVSWSPSRRHRSGRTGILISCDAIRNVPAVLRRSMNESVLIGDGTNMPRPVWLLCLLLCGARI